jgi:Tfp pilus assembly protein PilF
MLFAILFVAFAAPPLTPDMLRGFDHVYNLEYDQALTYFRQNLAAHPQDPQNSNHVAQTILNRAMLKAGALESELVSGTNPFFRRERMNPTAAEQQDFDTAIQTALARANERIAANPRDANSQYSLAVTYGLRANYNFLVRKAWLDSLKDSTAARKHAQLALDADPTYTDAKLILGLHDYIVGSLSWAYKMLGFIAGIKGDRDGGIRTMELVANSNANNRTDAKVLLAAIYRRERHSAKAIPLCLDLMKVAPRNYLVRLELAQMYGDVGEREKALQTMDDTAAAFPNFSREKLAYLKGNLLFWFDEYEKAVTELSRATAKAQSLDPNTGLSAYLRLGMTHDLMNQRPAAKAAYQGCIALAPGSDFAKDCERYLNKPYKRARIQ